MKLEDQTYNHLISHIGDLLQKGRQQASQSVNAILVQTYWLIGQHIVEFEQKGEYKSEYGSQLLDNLSKDLTARYGKGFSRSNIFQIRLFYLKFPKVQTLSGLLTWSHYTEILKADNDLEISFYSKQCEHERWSVRELKRQMKSSLFERIALSKDKEGVLKLANKGHIVETPEDLIKDPFVLEFLNIPQQYQYLENELEEKIISNLHMSIGGKHFYLDLFFYHRILKCFVLVDLKRGEIDHQDIGQMNLYLNYFKKEEASEGDNEPVGIILGAYKNHILIEYATDSITNKVLLSKYQLYLPDKKVLQNQLNKLLETNE